MLKSTIIIYYMIYLLEHLANLFQVYTGLVKIPIVFGTFIIIIFNNHTKELLLEHRSFIAAVIIMLGHQYIYLFNPYTVKGEFKYWLYLYSWQLTPLPTFLFATRYLECPTRLIETKIPNIIWYSYKAFTYAFIILILGSYFILNYYFAMASYYLFQLKLELFDEFELKANKWYYILDYTSIGMLFSAVAIMVGA